MIVMSRAEKTDQGTKEEGKKPTNMEHPGENSAITIDSSTGGSRWLAGEEGG